MIRAQSPRAADRTRPARVRTHPGPHCLTFAGVADPVVIRGAPDLVAALGRVLKGWPCRVTDAASRQAGPGVLASVAASRKGLTATSRYTDAPLPGLSLASAACAVVADLSQGYIDSQPQLRALHCGAVEVNGRLVVLTGAHRAGKSTLIARLTAEPDMRVFCDDVLPVLPDGQGLALGIAPRLRLPLPAAASPAFRAHVAQWAGVQDARYAYLSTPMQAAHGAQAPLSAIVVLDRRADGPARLHAMATDVALRNVLARNMAGAATAEAAFAQMHALVKDLHCLRLVYSDLEEAVTLLRSAFGGPSSLNPEVPVGADQTDPPAPPADLRPADPHQVWRQNPQVARRQVAESQFLWLPDDPTLWHLNPLAGAIWTLLEIPGSATDLAEALAEVFPAQPKGGILSDTALLLAQLAAQEMILPA